MAVLRDFDRRWIFLAMGLIVVGLFALGFTAEAPVSEYVQRYHDSIEDLPANSVVMLSADFDPGSAAELLPMYQATIHHLLRRGIRIINVSTWPAADPFMRSEFLSIPPLYGKEYGVDWVELGFKPGDDVAMGQIAQSVRSTYAQDSRDKKPIDSFPLLRGIGDSFQGIAMLITISAGYPGILEWIAQAGGRYGIPILTGTTAVQTPDLYAYYPSQVKGFLGAATGAAAYLQLVSEGSPGLAQTTKRMQTRMLIQTWGHFLIIALIVVGNVIYFTGRKRGT